MSDLHLLAMLCYLSTHYTSGSMSVEDNDGRIDILLVIRPFC